MSETSIDISKEAKKLERQKKKAADLLQQQTEEQNRKLAWDEGYRDRVKQYRDKIKEACLTEVLTVDADLNISVSFQEEELNVAAFRFIFPECSKKLDVTINDYDYNFMLECVQEYIGAKEAHRKFLADVKAFKDSLTKDQLKMVGYFAWVT
jgi:hypothetical protein